MRGRGRVAAYDRVATRLLDARLARPPPGRLIPRTKAAEITRRSEMGFINIIRPAGATIRDGIKGDYLTPWGREVQRAEALRNWDPVAGRPVSAPDRDAEVGTWYAQGAGRDAGADRNGAVEGLDYETGVPGRTEAAILADYWEGRIDRGEYERQADARAGAIEGAGMGAPVRRSEDGIDLAAERVAAGYGRDPAEPEVSTAVQVTAPDGSRFVTRDLDLARVANLYRPEWGYACEVVAGQHNAQPADAQPVDAPPQQPEAGQ